MGSRLLKIAFKGEKLLFFIFLSIILCVLDSWLFIQFLSNSLSLNVLIFCHLSLLLLAYLSIPLSYYSNENDMRFPYLTSIFFTALGPWGAGITTFSLILYGFYALTSRPSSWLEDISDEKEVEIDSELYERILYGLEDLTPKKTVVSYQDIISFGSEKQKRNAIEKMLKYFIPEFFPLLLKLLNDPNNSVRVHAATAMTRLDKQYYDKYLSLEKFIDEYPNQTHGILELAKHCEVCLDSNIFDSNRQHRILQTAIFAYAEYLQIKPNDHEIYIALARLHLKAGDPIKAKSVLSQLIHADEFKHFPKVDTLWMQILFELNEFENLRSFSRKLNNPSNELVRLWSGAYAK